MLIGITTWLEREPAKAHPAKMESKALEAEEAKVVVAAIETPREDQETMGAVVASMMVVETTLEMETWRRLSWITKTC